MFSPCSLGCKRERPLNERRRHDVLENREWTPLAQGCTEQRTWAIVLWIGTAKVAHAFDKAMSERDHLIQDATSARAGLTGFNMHHALPLGIVLLIGLYALATLLFGQP
jgi:hypothetical protein